MGEQEDSKEDIVLRAWLRVSAWLASSGEVYIVRTSYLFCRGPSKCRRSFGPRKKKVYAGDGCQSRQMFFDAGSGFDLQCNDAFVIQTRLRSEESGLFSSSCGKLNGSRS